MGSTFYAKGLKDAIHGMLNSVVDRATDIRPVIICAVGFTRSLLTSYHPIPNVTTSQLAPVKGFPSFLSVTPESDVTDEYLCKPSSVKECDVVTLENRERATENINIPDCISIYRFQDGKNKNVSKLSGRYSRRIIWLNRKGYPRK